MKILHLSDLHLGKRLNGFSLIEDQEHILSEILKTAAAEKPAVVLICGDIYDRSVPSEEAVRLFDSFIAALASMRIQVFAIAGNHDSAERLAFGASLMNASGVHFSPVYDGNLRAFPLTEGGLTVDVFMLPFIRPLGVRRFFPDEEIESYTDAVRCAAGAAERSESRVSILMAHQFVTGSATCDSEEKLAGGLDNADASAFEGFDYVALGHLHGPQFVGPDKKIRYCGTPLKYSFSEASHEKSVTVLEIESKDRINVRTVPLVPKRDMRELRGTYAQLVSRENYEGTATEDYIRVTLTDEEEVPEVMSRLRVIYPNIMELRYDNGRTRESAAIKAAEAAETKTPAEYLAEFYEKQNNVPLSEGQRQLAERLLAAMEREA